MNELIKFSPANEDVFFKILRFRINKFFEENKKSRKANKLMFFKTVLFISMLCIAYSMLFIKYENIIVFYGIWLALGLSATFTGLNIAHDAVHGAYSNNKNVNHYLGFIFYIIGANPYMWGIIHNRIHHNYTNIQDHDSDISYIPFVRLTPHQKRRWYHRYQHIYIYYLYCFTTLAYVFFKDYHTFFLKKIGNFENLIHPGKELINLFFYKILYFIIYIGIPVMFIQQPWYIIVSGFFFMHFVAGLVLAIIFNTGHLVDSIEFPLPTKENKIERTWATHQMYTTSSFARKSRIVNFLFGGLNFQIEHHLFPGICHIHYKDISGLVKSTAEEFNIPYIENKTFLDTLSSHKKLLKYLGTHDFPSKI